MFNFLHKTSRYCLLAVVFITVASLYSTLLYAGWETSNPFRGVTYSKLRDSDVHPILDWSYSPLSVNVMEIDLDAEGIGFFCTPSNGAASGETTFQTTMNFMTSSNTEIAINTNFFSWSPPDCLGMVYSNGNLVSPFSSAWPSINISPDNQAELITATDLIHDYPYGNAFSGSVLVVKNGEVVANSDTAYHPRTAAGYNEEENKLILMTVDGRQDESIGVKLQQLGTLMANFGATWAVNFDGGGSTQMTINDGTARYVNSPSETYRAVAANLGVHAIADTSYHEFATFEHNNRATFEYEPGYSGSSYGFIESSSHATLVDTTAGIGQGALRVDIVDDGAQAGQWFARIVSGSSATRSQNTIRAAAGYVGLMAKTSDEGAFISLAVDDPNTGDRGVRKELYADGEWHWYQWEIGDDDDWESWISAGNGQIDGADFTIDSVQIWGDDDATVFLDQISHSTTASLAPLVAEDDDYRMQMGDVLFVETDDGLLSNDYHVGDGLLFADNVEGSEPSHGQLGILDDGRVFYIPDAGFTGTESFLYKAFDYDGNSDYARCAITVEASATPGDANQDGVVDSADATILAAHWQKEGYWSSGDFNGDRIVDDLDAVILSLNWTTPPATNASVPEPGSIMLLLAGTLLLSLRRKRSARTQE